MGDLATLLSRATEIIEELARSSPSSRTRMLCEDILVSIQSEDRGWNDLIRQHDYEPPMMRAVRLSQELVAESHDPADQSKISQLRDIISQLLTSLLSFRF
jgi:hypothetical protein